MASRKSPAAKKTAAKKTAAKKTAARSPKETALSSFPDRNLRLAIVQALRDTKKLPAFDHDAFYRRTTGKKYDVCADDNYEYNEEIARELANSPVSDAMLDSIEDLSWGSSDGVVFDIRKLTLRYQPLGDLRPLVGSGVVELVLDDDSRLKVLAPLLELPKLKKLSLQRSVYQQGEKPPILKAPGNAEVVKKLQTRGVTVTVR
jgi:hypothetical protein